MAVEERSVQISILGILSEISRKDVTPMKNYIHNIRTTLKIKLWHLWHKVCILAMTLSQADYLTIAACMYTIAEKGLALQEWTPGDWISAYAFFCMIREKWKSIE